MSDACGGEQMTTVGPPSISAFISHGFNNSMLKPIRRALHTLATTTKLTYSAYPVPENGQEI